MSSQIVPNSHAPIKTDTLPLSDEAACTTFSTPSNRLTKYEVAQPAGTNGNGRYQPHRGGDSRPDGHSGNGHQHGRDDLPGADEERALNYPNHVAETRNPFDLKPYPLQEHFFADESEEADLQLAADMHKNGQREPIQILPDNTIIKGHRRTAAAKHNGWTTINVVVRHDLAGNDNVIEEEFLNDNYMRRHLSPLQQARCAKRLDALAKANKLTERQLAALEGKTRDKIGRLLNVSGKTVERWLRILRAPMEVQLAFDKKKLGIEVAAKVCGLDEKTQQKIATEIKSRGFDHAKAITKEHMPKKAETWKGPDKVYTKLKQAIHEAFEEGLSCNVERIGWQLPKDVELLTDAEDLLLRLRLQIEDVHAEDEEEEDVAA